MATNDYRGGSEKSEFHPVVTWDWLAEICAQYLDGDSYRMRAHRARAESLRKGVAASVER